MKSRLLAAGSTVAVLLVGCCPLNPWDKPEPVGLDVSVDLRAVTRTQWSATRPFVDSYLAVGEQGTVVVWGPDPSSRRHRLLSDTFTVGNRDLNAVADLFDRWMVVGDDGFAAVSTDEGESWTTLDFGITSDLHGILSVFDGTLIFGDEVVLYGPSEGDWTELTPPDGGWGELRGGYEGYRTYLVGRFGVAWSGSPEGTWTAQSTGTGADLLAIGAGYLDSEEDHFVVVGTHGTLLRFSTYGGWVPIDVGTTVDFVDVSAHEGPSGMLLAADGSLYRLGDSVPEELVEIPGALAVSYEDWSAIAVVGNDGLASMLWCCNCEG